MPSLIRIEVGLPWLLRIDQCIRGWLTHSILDTDPFVRQLRNLGHAIHAGHQLTPGQLCQYHMQERLYLQLA
jgi:hypothetical protein